MAKSKISASEKLRLKYNDLVDEVGRQLRILEQHDPNSVALSRYRNKFQKVTTMDPHYRTMKTQIDDIRQVLSSGELSLDTQERSIANALKTLHDDGYDFINRKNFNYFMSFLDDARARHLGRLYSSEQMLTAISVAKRRGLTRNQILQNMDRWASQIKYDTEGKMIEVEKPKKLYVKNYDNKRK